MKKQIVTMTMLAMMSAPALATKARMLALGENISDNIGSFYFSDSRNMFQNAAFINDYKNMIITEWGANGGTASAKADTDTAPQAEGGFTASTGKFAYGLYLGAESPYTNEIRKYTRTLSNNAFHQDNQLDAWFGGESDFKWGVNLTYSASKDNSVSGRQQSTSVRFGIIKDKLEAFANVALSNYAKQAATGTGNLGGKDSFKGHNGYELGATYDVSLFKVFGYVRHASWASDGQSQAGQTAATSFTAYQGKFDGDYWLYQLGVGRELKINDKATLFTKLEYYDFKREVDPKTGSASKKVSLNDWRAPVTVGLEYDSTSWLTLRGSVVQNILSEENNNYRGQEGSISAAVKGLRASGKKTIANSTNVNAGATLKFGNLSIDGVLGTNNGAGSVSTTTAEKGVLSLSNLMTRVAMTYRF